MYFLNRKTSWDVEMTTLNGFVVDKNVGKNIFIKMDIEGAVYEVLPKLPSRFFSEHDIKMCLSLHPHLIAQSVRGNNTISKKIGGVKVVWGSYRVLKIAQKN